MRILFLAVALFAMWTMPAAAEEIRITRGFQLCAGFCPCLRLTVDEHSGAGVLETFDTSCATLWRRTRVGRAETSPILALVERADVFAFSDRYGDDTAPYLSFEMHERSKTIVFDESGPAALQVLMAALGALERESFYANARKSR